MAEDKRIWPTSKSDYELLEEIGQGVSAIVYRARCIPFNEVVAVKCLDLEKCNNTLEEIRKEAQTMSLINHPNLVKAHCSFVVDANLWVVMPFIAGGSCLHIMKAAYPEGFDEPIIATILKDALKALDYLHRHGHIHRDVKAGNVLMDMDGNVKLADYGVSACMFDCGDRQKSRQTFVGTPCWMAPEVMEQVHGYDFRADIWSFGITSLELAHGHAPFSKYPPMKVLLMTLQNAPPSLDYPQDKRFSKAFKEMIGLCLVKDPTKRPTAEKLLRHSFFKHAKTNDYLVRHVLDGLAPLSVRVQQLKAKDLARRAQAKIPLQDVEDKSQNEYKRGISSWNFDLEDLKEQASMMDDDEPLPPVPESTRGELRTSRSRSSSLGDDYDRESPRLIQPSPSPPAVAGDSKPSVPAGVPLPAGVKADLAAELDGRGMPRARSGPISATGPLIRTSSSVAGQQADGKQKVVPLATAASGASKARVASSGPLPVGRKEPKHIGRFDVFEDDFDKSPDWRPTRERVASTQAAVLDRLGPAPAGGGGERVVTLERSDSFREREVRSVSVGAIGGPPADKSRRASLVEQGAVADTQASDYRGVAEHRLMSADGQKRLVNGVGGGVVVTAVRGGKEEERPKGGVVRKGRFSVSEEEPSGGGQKPAGATDWGGDVVPPPRGSTPSLPPSPWPQASQGTVSVASILPQLQGLLNASVMQQDTIMQAIMSLGPSDLRGYARRDLSRSASGTIDSPPDLSSEREVQLNNQVAELMARNAALQEEFSRLKQRNSQLEWQLNAIYNQEEERRIKAEEVERGNDGE